jgi:hypothetical protein
MKQCQFFGYSPVKRTTNHAKKEIKEPIKTLKYKTNPCGIPTKMTPKKNRNKTKLLLICSG